MSSATKSVGDWRENVRGGEEVLPGPKGGRGGVREKLGHFSPGRGKEEEEGRSLEKAGDRPCGGVQRKGLPLSKCPLELLLVIAAEAKPRQSV